MSWWSRLTGSEPAAPPPRIEPTLALAAPALKQSEGGSLVGTINSLAFPQPMLYAALGGYASNTGVPVTPLTSLQAAAVYGCTKCISEDIAGLRVYVRQRRGRNIVTVDKHPINALLRKPNRWQTGYQFWQYVLTAYCLRGNSYIVINRGPDGSPQELMPVTPDRVTMRITPDGDVWYRVNSRRVGLGVLVPAEDMIHMKNMSVDGYLGVSPIACAQDVIGLALATQQHGAVLFRQGARLSGVFQHPGKLSKEASDNIAQSARDVHAGVQNAHKVMVLEEGMTYEPITMTNEDAQFLATRQFQVVDICARIYRVPPHKLGEYGRATFGNVEQQQQGYIDDCLQSHTNQLEELCDDLLLFEDERDAGYEVHWDYTSMLTGDTAQRYASYQIGLLNGFLSRNEVRAKENMNPVPGGDEYRVPLNTADPMHPENMPQTLPKPRDDGEGDGEREGDDEDEDEEGEDR